MKLIKELQDTCTTQEIISVCEDLQKEGHRVVIKHQNGRIRVYEEADWDEIDWTDESGSIAFREHDCKKGPKTVEGVFIGVEQPQMVLLSMSSHSEKKKKKIEVEKLRALYHHLAKDAPSADSPHWNEYEDTMRDLERQLREAGVEL